MKYEVNKVHNVLKTQGFSIPRKDFLDVARLMVNEMKLSRKEDLMLTFTSRHFNIPIDEMKSSTRKSEVITAKHCYVNLVHRQRAKNKINQSDLMRSLNMNHSSYSPTIKKYKGDKEFGKEYRMFEIEYIKSLSK